MTKTKLHETIIALCDTHKVPKAFKTAIDELTKPKVGGSSDVNDYTAFDEAGVATHVFCTYHKQWEPVTGVRTIDATEEEEAYEEDFNLFVADTKSKNGLRRFCDEGDKQWKESSKIFNQSKTAIMADVLDEAITGSEAKTQIEALQATRDVHSARVDGLGSTNKPGSEDSEEA